MEFLRSFSARAGQSIIAACHKHHLCLCFVLYKPSLLGSTLGRRALDLSETYRLDAMILIGVKQSSLVGDGEQDSGRLIHYCLGEVDDAISVPHWSHIKCQERWNLRLNKWEKQRCGFSRTRPCVSLVLWQCYRSHMLEMIHGC